MKGRAVGAFQRVVKHLPVEGVGEGAQVLGGVDLALSCDSVVFVKESPEAGLQILVMVDVLLDLGDVTPLLTPVRTDQD